MMENAKVILKSFGITVSPGIILLVVVITSSMFLHIPRYTYRGAGMWYTGTITRVEFTVNNDNYPVMQVNTDQDSVYVLKGYYNIEAGQRIFIGKNRSEEYLVVQGDYITKGSYEEWRFWRTNSPEYTLIDSKENR